MNFADGVNNFVNISRTISGSDFGIKCTFINQSTRSEKVCSVAYGEVKYGCRNPSLTLNASASSSGGNSVDIGLDLDSFYNSSRICFVVTASVTGVKTVKIEGTFDTGQFIYTNWYL